MKDEIINLIKERMASFNQIKDVIKAEELKYNFIEQTIVNFSINKPETYGNITADELSMVLSLVLDDMRKIKIYVQQFENAKKFYIKIDKAMAERFLALSDNSIRKKTFISLQKSTEEEVKNIFDKIKNKMNELSDSITSKKRKVRKLNSNYSEIITMINEANNKILDFNQVEKMDIDDDIKYEVLIYILKHNANLNKIVSEENSILSEGKNKLMALLTQFGYDYNNLSSVEISDLLENVNMVETKLMILNSMNIYIEEKEPFLAILKYSNLDILNNIKDIVDKYNISSNFIINNIDILFNEELYNTFITNINYLKEKGISIFNIDEDILIMNCENLVKNIDILEQYNFGVNRINNFNLLKDISLLDMIDSYIEQGLYTYILENQGIIKNDYNIIIRLLITNYLGISVFNNNNRIITSITSGKGFEFDIEQMKDLIINDVELYLSSGIKEVLDSDSRNNIVEEIMDLDIIKDLYSYAIDNMTLSFNGQLISLNKVLRNFSSLYLNNPNGDLEEYLFESIIYNSVLDSFSIENIKKIIKKDKVYKNKNT